MKTEKKQSGIVFAVMSMYFFIPSMGIILASFAAIAEAYPHVSFGTISYLSTSVALAQIPSALLVSTVAGKRIKYKTLCVWSMALFTMAGTLPFFFPNETPFWILMITRILVGFALGIFSPIANTFIVKLFAKEEQRATVLGYGNVVFNVGAISLQMLGGFLCAISWQTTFLAHLLGIIALIVVAVFLKEPPQVNENKTEKIKIPLIAYGYLGIFMITLILTYPMMTSLAVVMHTANIGNSALAGTLLSLLSVIGIIIAALFGTIYKRLKRFVLPASVLCIAVGFALLFVSSNPDGFTSLPMFIVGICLVSAGLIAVTIGTPMLVSSCAKITFTMLGKSHSSIHRENRAVRC